MQRRLPARPRLRERRPSSIARYCLCFYTLLVVGASLFPFTGWRDLGIAPFAYLNAEMPARWWRFDFIVNVLGYLPIGLLASLALYPGVRGIWAIVPATFYGFALSGALESLQTYLPGRVASKIDLLSNGFGALLGAAAALGLAGPLLEHGRLRDPARRWLRPEAGFGVVLTAMWFGALTYPEPFALGVGGVLRPLANMLLDWAGAKPIEPWLTPNFIAAEASVCLFALIAAGVLLLSILGEGAPRRRLLLAFTVSTILVKTAAQSLASSDEGMLGWISEGALWGVGPGLLILLGLSAVPERLRAGIGFSALLVAVALTNILADNPYYDPDEHAWAYGRFLNFYGLTLGLNYFWPFLALWYLGRRSSEAPRAWHLLRPPL